MPDTQFQTFINETFIVRSFCLLEDLDSTKQPTRLNRTYFCSYTEDKTLSFHSVLLSLSVFTVEFQRAVPLLSKDKFQVTPPVKWEMSTILILTPVNTQNKYKKKETI